MKTRAQVAAAILNNFSTAINATETAYNSAGSAAEENAKVLESLNGHIQAFKAEWESLVNSKSTQDALKMFIDLGTTIIKLIKSVGGLGTALTQLLAVWSMFKMAKFGGTLIETTTSVTSLSMALNRAGLAYTFAGGGIKGFSAALASSKIAMATATAGLTLLIAALGFIINKFQEAKQKHDEWIESTLNAAETNQKNLNTLLENANIYKELANKINKTEEEESEFKTVESEIISVLGEKAEALNKLQEGTEDYKKAVEELTKAEIENLTAQLYVTQNAAEDKLKSLVTPWWGIQTIGKSTSDVSYDVLNAAGLTKKEHYYSEMGAGSDLIYLKGASESSELYKSGKIDEVEHAINEYAAYADALEVLNKKIVELNQNHKYEEANAIASSDMYKKITERVNELKDSYTTKMKTQLQILELADYEQNGLIDTEEEYDNLINTIQNNTTYSDRHKELLIEMAQNAYPQFSKSVEESSEAIENNSFEMTQLSEATKDELTSLKELETAYSTLSSALEEYNENGGLSAKTIDTLITEYSDYLQYLVDENGHLDLNEQAIQAVVNAKKEDIKATIIQEALNRIDSLKAQTEEEKKLAQEIENQTQKIKENNQARFESLALLPMEDLGANAEEIKNIIDDAQRRIALLSQLFVGGGSGRKVSSAAKKTTDTWKAEFTTAYNDLKNRRDRDIIDTETYYKELNELNKKYFEGRKEYAEEYAKYELELYKGIQEVFKENIDNMEHDYTMLENQGVGKDVLINKYKEIQDELHRQAEYYRSLNLDGNKDLIDKLSEDWWKYQKNIEKLQKEITDDLKKNLDEQIDELKKRFEALRDVALDTIEKQIDEKQNWLEEQNDLLDEQINKYKDQKDTMEDEKEIQEKLLKIEEARKKLAEAKNKKVRVYREGKGFVYETDFDAVNEAQEQLNDLLEDWQLFQEKARIQDIVEQLEAEKQANKDRVNKEIEDLNRLKDAWDKSLDLAQDIENYKGWLTKIENSESDSFNSRLNLVKEFVNSYNAEMKQLQTQYPTETKTTTSNSSSSSGGSGGSGGVVVKKYNGVSYNPNVDYQQMINDAKAANAPADHLVSLEKQRNAKIAGEGITNYSPTYNYTSPSSSSSKSSSSSSKSSSSSSSSSNSSSSSSSSGTLLSKVTSAVSTVIKAVTGYASGTEDADGMMHFVGENGPELYVPPEGAGIIPSKLTGNLMAWGTINPMQLVKSFKNGDGTVIQIDNVELPNVKDGESFVNELKNFKSFAIQRDSNRK